MEHGDSDQYQSNQELTQQIDALERDLERQRELNYKLEKSYQTLGRERMAIENEYAETKRLLSTELEEQKRLNAELSMKLEHAERSNAKLQEDVNKMTRELLGVMKMKSELTKSARRETRKQMADEERIRADLSRQQRNHEQRTRSPSNPAPPPPPPMTVSRPPAMQNPKTIRSINALREIQDFFEF